MTKRSKIIWSIVGTLTAFLMLAGGIAGYVLMVRPIVTEEHWLYVTDSTQLGYPGAYRLPAGMTWWQRRQTLRRRQQTPVRVTFSTYRQPEQWAGHVAERLMLDSTALVKALYDPAFLAEAETDSAGVMGILLADTYEMYWTITPDDLMRRMLREYHRFWNESRQAKAEGWGLTPQEVTVLASIAEEETRNRHERGVVAMLYWNRLQMGMMLQADPTVKYAMGDFALRRILNSHLETPSPYNTYLHEGLPPGPIRMVEKATLDTILNARQHPYLYMCAKPELNGLHNFATTYADHLRNAAAYHRALSRMGR